MDYRRVTTLIHPTMAAPNKACSSMVQQIQKRSNLGWCSFNAPLSTVVLSVQSSIGWDDRTCWTNPR